MKVIEIVILNYAFLATTEDNSQFNVVLKTIEIRNLSSFSCLFSIYIRAIIGKLARVAN